MLEEVKHELRKINLSTEVACNMKKNPAVSTQQIILKVGNHEVTQLLSVIGLAIGGERL